MKKPILQRKWVWAVIALVIFVGGYEVKTRFDKFQDEKARVTATKNANKILEGKIAVPDPYFKSKDEVAGLFEDAGLKAKFEIVNMDDKADINKKSIKAGDCDQLNLEQANLKYYGDEEVGDKFGVYADKGATITVGYSDHDYGSGETQTSSSENEKTTAEKDSSRVVLNSNEAIKNYLNDSDVLEVGGVYAVDGEYTAQITIKDDSGSIRSEKESVIQVIKKLNSADLSKFSGIGISVKAMMTDGKLGYAIKSNWSPAFITSEKPKALLIKNVPSFADSWWQIEY